MKRLIGYRPSRLVWLGSALLAIGFAVMFTLAWRSDARDLQNDLSHAAKQQAQAVRSDWRGLMRDSQTTIEMLAASPHLARMADAARQQAADVAGTRQSRADIRRWLAQFQPLLASRGITRVQMRLAGKAPPWVSMNLASHATTITTPLPKMGAAKLVMAGDETSLRVRGQAVITEPGSATSAIATLVYQASLFNALQAHKRLADGDIAVLYRTPGAPAGDAATAWQLGPHTASNIENWWREDALDGIEDENRHVEIASDGRRYLLTLVTFGTKLPAKAAATAAERATPMVALLVWSDVTTAFTELSESRTDTVLRWGGAWLLAQICLLGLLVGTRRVTTRLMARHEHDLLEQQKALRALNTIAALPEKHIHDQLRMSLRMAAEYLGLPYAIISHIEYETYTVVMQHSPPDTLIDGQTFPLHDTYCQETLAADDVVGFAAAGDGEFADHPCRELFQLESYIGAPLWVRGEPYGTLNFASPTRREHEYTDAEREFVRLMARWVGSSLARGQDLEARDELSGRLRKIASQASGLFYQFRRSPRGEYSFPYASEAIHAIYEMSPEEAKHDASRVFAMIDAEDLPAINRTLEHSVETLAPWHCEYRVHYSDGRIAWLSGQAIPEREADGGILWHGFIHDITERKQAEQLKSEFVSVVSHELRTPLTSISGGLGLVLGGALGELPESMRAMLDIAHNNAQRLALLINDLLDIDKLNAGKMRIELKQQPLMPLVEQAIASNRAYASQYGVSLVMTSRLDEAQVCVDDMRLQQVMSNLLSNAVKYSPRGVPVTINVEAVANAVRISVTDSGPGIPPEFRGRIFEKFSQADSTSTRHVGGTGLGLAITQQLVQRMNGQLDFESEPGQGSCFYVELPRYDGTMLSAVDVKLPASHERRVLIVQKDIGMATKIADLISEWGYRPSIAHSAQSAFALLADESFDALTLDVGLPGLDGIGFLSQLRANPAHAVLPVIIVSELVDGECLDPEAARQLDYVDWLPIPMDEDQFAAALSAAFARGEVKPKVLHVEDDMDLVKVVAELARDIAELDMAATLTEARRHLAATHYDLILLDLALPDGSGWDLLDDLDALTPRPAVIVLSATELGGEELSRVDLALAKSRISNQQFVTMLARLLESSDNSSGGRGAVPKAIV